MEKEKTKLNYNPLKMWGSWVGFFIPLALVIMGYACQILFDCIGCQKEYPVLCKFIFGYLFKNNLTILLYLIGGFVAGWAIHSLVRKLRSNKK